MKVPLLAEQFDPECSVSQALEDVRGICKPIK